MKVRRRGGLRVELADQEVALLDDLFAQLDELLDSSDGSDAVLRRLSPDAYPDDPEASAEFRDLTGTAMRGERVALCRGELATCEGALSLAEEEVSRRWLQALNDLRLALGTRLGVRADGPPYLDPADPEQHPWAVYHWLTAMQDQLVTALMR